MTDFLSIFLYSLPETRCDFKYILMGLHNSNDVLEKLCVLGLYWMLFSDGDGVSKGVWMVSYRWRS